MYILQKNDSVIIKDLDHFNLKQTLECGQCFRFYTIEVNKFLIIAYNKVLVIEQKKQDIIFYNTTIDEFNTIWYKYFDFDNNYGLIKDRLQKTDKTLSKAIESTSGIRILKQDIFETLISFIISQNKNIKHIKKVIENMSMTFGEPIKEINGITYYSFPTIEQLKNANEADLRACKTGFRAPYILDAVDKIANGILDLKELQNKPTSYVKDQLTTIKGVGDKIADCVLLFAYSRYEVFPTDVWILRIIETLYLNEKANKKHVQQFAKQQFGDLAGYAQQYLFYYGRENKIGK